MYVYKYGIIINSFCLFVLLCLWACCIDNNLFNKIFNNFFYIQQVFGHLIQNHLNQFVKKFNVKSIIIKEYLNHLHHQYGRLEVLDHHQLLIEKNFDKYHLNLQLLVEKIINRWIKSIFLFSFFLNYFLFIQGLYWNKSTLGFNWFFLRKKNSNSNFTIIWRINL